MTNQEGADIPLEILHLDTHFLHLRCILKIQKGTNGDKGYSDVFRDRYCAVKGHCPSPLFTSVSEMQYFKKVFLLVCASQQQVPRKAGLSHNASVKY